MSIRILSVAVLLAFIATITVGGPASAQKGAKFTQKANERFDKRAEMAKKKKQQSAAQNKKKKKN